MKIPPRNEVMRAIWSATALVFARAYLEWPSAELHDHFFQIFISFCFGVSVVMAARAGSR